MIALDPGTSLPYDNAVILALCEGRVEDARALVAEARRSMGDGLGANEDLDAAASGPQADRLGPTIQPVQLGTLSCRTVLD